MGKVKYKHIFLFLHIFTSLKSVSAASDKMPVAFLFFFLTVPCGKVRTDLSKNRKTQVKGDTGWVISVQPVNNWKTSDPKITIGAGTWTVRV